MQHITRTDRHGNKWNRVSKVKAEQIFNAGKEILLVPAKFCPTSELSISYEKQYTDYSFSELVKNFAWYNCTYETGYYPAYYQKLN